MEATQVGAATPRPPDDPWWRDDAACVGADTETFFPVSYAHTPHKIHPVGQHWCVTCPVRRQCLDEALNDETQHGIRGGLTPRQRRKILRNRKKNP